MPNNFAQEQYKNLNKHITPPTSTPTFEKLQQAPPSKNPLHNLPNNANKPATGAKVSGMFAGIKNLPTEAAKFERKRGAGWVALALGTMIVGTYGYTVWSMKQESFTDVVIPDTFKEKTH